MADRPFLKQGKRHAAVLGLKKLLADQGYWDADTESTFYGPKLAEAVAYFQQTHLGEDGKALDVDGKVGNQTWWSLDHPSGEAQRSHIVKEPVAAGAPDSRIPDGLSADRVKLLKTALKYHGAREQPPGSNRGPVVDKFLPKWWKVKYGPHAKGPAWCAFYVSTVDKEANGTFTLGKRIGSCSLAVKEAKMQGRWRANDGSYVPQPGDAFVMLYTGTKAGKGHIGWVLRTAMDAKSINTTEGNCGNRVKVGVRDLGKGSHIAGFIVFCDDSPDFERGIIDAKNVAAQGTR